MSCFSPRMLIYVSCWPAKDASGRSSAVADERTATERSASPHLRHSCLYDVKMSFSSCLGLVVQQTDKKINQGGDLNKPLQLHPQIYVRCPCDTIKSNDIANQ